MNKISVVILNWNGVDDTIACLKSIQELSLKDYKLSVIVVDNKSSDDSLKRLREIKLKNAGYELLTNNANYGFAKGNNIGIANAIDGGAEYILVLNNDTEVDSQTLQRMVGFMNNNPQFGAISPKIYFAKGYEFHKKRYRESDLGKVIWYAGGDIDWANVYGANHGVDEVDQGQFEEVRETDFSTGACSLLRVETLKKVGLYEEKYFMYLEDVDLSVRIKKSGWKIGYCDGAHIWHKVAQSSSVGSDLNDYFITRNRMFFGFRYASVRAKVALIKESFRLLLAGRKWQRVGVKDFYLGKLGKGSWR
jgi:hypothetical protein